MKNKKAALDILDLVSIIVIFLLVFSFIFFINFQRAAKGFQKTTQELYGEESLDNTITLISYLKTPIDDKTISDLIISSYYKNDYTQLTQKTKEIIKNLNNENEENSIVLIKEETMIKEIGELSRTKKLIVTEIDIPLNEKEKIKIRLIKNVKK
jgi:hypothetical protein